jgi:hypothetical protein
MVSRIRNRCRPAASLGSEQHTKAARRRGGLSFSGTKTRGGSPPTGFVRTADQATPDRPLGGAAQSAPFLLFVPHQGDLHFRVQDLRR